MATSIISKLGNFVWDDKNGDGIQDAGEIGLSGVKVSLYGQDGDGNWTVWESTTTNAQGMYSLVNFADGDMVKVRFELPAGGYGFSPNAGAITNANNSDVVDLVNGYTNSWVISNATNNPHVTVIPGDPDIVAHNYVDAGIFKYASLSNRVWNDVNADGIQGAGEAGLDGVTVRLLKADGSSTGKSVVTANGGKYTLTDVAPGNYKLEFVAPNGYTYSPADQGTDDTKDSDALSDGKTAQFSVISGQSLNNISAGLFRYATIGNFVWDDRDVNGVQGPTESGLAGVNVELRKFSDNSLVATTASGANGAYQFSLLKPGDYKVKFIPATDYVLTAQKVGGNTAKDSDANATTGFTDKITVTNGQTNNDIDGGVYKLNTISGQAWADNDANGQRAASETKVANVVVRLMQGATEIARTTTDGNGLYNFKQVKPGTYTIQVTKPTNYLFTHQDYGSDATDSDVDVTTGISANLVLTSSMNKVVDVGLYNKAGGDGKIGDKVWLDSDKDGKQVSASDTGVVGVTVNLFDSVGHFHRTTTTDTQGKYLFDEVLPGDYKVQFVAPNTHLFTQQYAGTDRNIDSNANASTGWTDSFPVKANDNVNSIDAGLYQPVGSIGNYVWLDKNPNGAQDSTEMGLNGVKVHLFKEGSTTEIAQTTTVSNGGKDGYYTFNNVVTGNYYLKFDLPNSSYEFTGKDKASDSIDSDADATGKTDVFSLTTSNLNITTLDAGLIQGGSISGLTWVDKVQSGKTNVNGTRDSNESMLPNVNVTLLTKAGATVATTKTLADGTYKFDQITPGDYVVKFTKPSGYTFTGKNKGGNDTIDSDADPSTGKVLNLSVKAGGDITHVDAGFFATRWVKGSMWLDHHTPGVSYPLSDGLRNAGDGFMSSVFYLIDRGGNILASESAALAAPGYSFEVPAGGQFKVGYKALSESNITYYKVGGGANYTIDSDYLPSLDTYDGTLTVETGEWAYTPYFTVPSGAGDNPLWHLDIGTTPLIIDVNGDGIHTLAREQNLYTFDLFGNGHAIQSGWVSAQDGLLCIDRDGNGKIDSINELFGGLNKGDGFAKLAEFDSNRDGVVNANDADFAALRVWVDANSNKITDADELKTLAELGMVSLKLDYVAMPELDESGNLHLERSSVMLADGKQLAMNDVYFNVSAQDAQSAGLNLPSMADLLSNDSGIPNLLGHNDHHVVGDSSALQQMVKLYDDVQLMQY